MSESAVGIIQLIPGSSGQSFFSGPVPVYVRSSYVTPSLKFGGLTITAYAELVSVSEFPSIKAALAKYKVKITRPQLLPKQEQKQQQQGEKQQQKQGIKGKYVQFEGIEEYGSGKMTLIKQMYDSIVKEEAKLSVEQSFAVGDKTPLATIEQQYDAAKLHEKLTAGAPPSSIPVPYHLKQEYQFEIVLPERYTYVDSKNMSSFKNIRIELLGPLVILVGELASDFTVNDTKAGTFGPKTITLPAGFPMAIPLTTAKSVGGLPEVLTSSEEESEPIKQQPKEQSQVQPKQPKQPKAPAAAEAAEAVPPAATEAVPPAAVEPPALEKARANVTAARREIARLSTMKTVIDGSQTASQADKDEAERNLTAARQKLLRANAELAGEEANLPAEPGSKEALRRAIENARVIADLLPAGSFERKRIEDEVNGIKIDEVTRFELPTVINTLNTNVEYAKEQGILYTVINSAALQVDTLPEGADKQRFETVITDARQTYKRSADPTAVPIEELKNASFTVNKGILLAKLTQLEKDVNEHKATLTDAAAIARIEAALADTAQINAASDMDTIEKAIKTLQGVLSTAAPPVIPPGPVTPPVIPPGPVTPPVIPANLTSGSDFTKIVKDAIRDVDLVKLEGENKIEECKKVFIDGIAGLLDQIQKDVATETNIDKLKGYLELVRKIYAIAGDTSQYPACLLTKKDETKTDIEVRIAPYIDLQTTLNTQIAKASRVSQLEAVKNTVQPTAEEAAKKAEADRAKAEAEAAAKKAADEKAEADRAAAEATRLATEAARTAAEEAAKKAEAAQAAAEEAAKKAEAAQAAADEAVKKAADEKAAAEAQANKLAAEKAAKLEALIAEANDDFVGLFIGAVQQNITTGSVSPEAITALGKQKDTTGVKDAESKLKSVIPKLLAIDNTYASSIIAVCDSQYTNGAGDKARICKSTAFKGLRQSTSVAAENVESTDEEAARIAAAKKAADEAAARIAAEAEAKKAAEAEAARIAEEKRKADEEAARIAAEAEAKKAAEAARIAEEKRKADEEAARIAAEAEAAKKADEAAPAAARLTPMQQQRVSQLQKVLQPTPAPVPGLVEPKTCGLQNVGNSCYMNAAIQLLAQIPEFRTFATQELVLTPISTAKCNVLNKYTVRALHALLREYYAPKKTQIDVTKLTVPVGNVDVQDLNTSLSAKYKIKEALPLATVYGILLAAGQFTPGTQEDAIELIRYAVMNTFDCFTETKDILQTFKFTIRTRILSTGDRKEISTTIADGNEVYIDDLGKNPSIEGFVTASEESTIEDYGLDRISAIKVVTREAKATTKTLLINAKRCKDTQPGTRKNAYKITINPILTIDTAQFKIQGAIIHSSTTCSGGHYIYQHFNPDGTAVAWTADDSSINIGTQGMAGQEYDPTTQGVVFVYRRVEAVPQEYPAAAPQTKKGRGRTRRRRNVSYKKRPKRKGTYKSTQRK